MDTTEITFADGAFVGGLSGLKMARVPTAEEFLEVGSHLHLVSELSKMQLADLFRFAKQHLGEDEAVYLAEKIGLTHSTYNQYVWVSGSILPANRRVDKLSFTAHRHVCALPGHLQKDALEHCIATGMNTVEFEIYVKGVKADHERGLPGNIEPLELDVQPRGVIVALGDDEMLQASIQEVPDGQRSAQAVMEAAKLSKVGPALQVIADAINRMSAAEEDCVADLNVEQFCLHLQNASAMIRDAAPYDTCLDCKGQGCTTCHMRGYTSKMKHTVMMANQRR